MPLGVFIDDIKGRLQYQGCGSASLHYNAYAGPAFHCNADPDPAFHFSADPDPAFHFNADPDPASYLSDANPRPIGLKTIQGSIFFNHQGSIFLLSLKTAFCWFTNIYGKKKNTEK